MNEYHRQVYLSALGIENYMPRRRLRFAPEPVACLLPVFNRQEGKDQSLSSNQKNSDDVTQVLFEAQRQVSKIPTPVADVLRDLTQEEKYLNTNSVSAVAPALIAQLVTVPAFALSLWRPLTNILIIDSRNTRLALPTELLLGNILRAIVGSDVVPGKEDVLRWPFVENAFVSRTFDDAKNALQVWLEVELEQRPAQKILLMGENAAQFLLPDDANYADLLWRSFTLTAFSANAVVVPSLVELLQQPLLKRNLWRSLQSWCD